MRRRRWGPALTIALAAIATARAGAIQEGPSATAGDPARGSIAVPSLPADAGKPALLAAYYAVTGEPMMADLLETAGRPPAGLLEQAAGCPERQAFIREVFATQVRPVIEGMVQDIGRELLEVLDQALTERDLRAFLRFAATPDGQRHLAGIRDREPGAKLIQFPAYERDPDLRSYHRHLDAHAERAGEVISGAERGFWADPELRETIARLRARDGELKAQCARKAGGG